MGFQYSGVQTSFKLTGAAELANSINLLKGRAGRKIIRDALRQGAEIAKIYIQSSALRMVGGELGRQIVAAMEVRGGRSKPNETTMHAQLSSDSHPELTSKPGTKKMVLVRKKGQKPRLESRDIEYFIPAAVEYGHGRPGQGGMREKTTPAIPFGRVGAAQAAGPAAHTSLDAIKQGIEALSERLAFQGKGK